MSLTSNQQIQDVTSNLSGLRPSLPLFECVCGWQDRGEFFIQPCWQCSQWFAWSQGRRFECFWFFSQDQQRDNWQYSSKKSSARVWGHTFWKDVPGLVHIRGAGAQYAKESKARVGSTGMQEKPSKSTVFIILIFHGLSWNQHLQAVSRPLSCFSCYLWWYVLSDLFKPSMSPSGQEEMTGESRSWRYVCFILKM